MKISALDHLVLTVADIDRTIAFYTQVLGMEEVSFGNNRKACIEAVRELGKDCRDSENALSPALPHGGGGRLQQILRLQAV
ncbi:VOC family protein [Neisseria meningitidis]|nr:VOC family protein [Neisseria meningitidis]